MNTRTYPAHFSVFARYQRALRKLDGERFPLGRMSADDALAELAGRPGIQLQQLC